MKILNWLGPIAVLCSPLLAQDYDLLLKGGHVVDGKNKINAVRDVAIRDGKIAAVEANIDPAKAHKVVSVAGFYVTPGLVDIHVHVYAGTSILGSLFRGQQPCPDGYTFRAAAATVVDATGARAGVTSRTSRIA